ncbi:hypothetical protein [Paraburkholderia sp.]|uniref:hypothetical protein n=1 Tax=Paraburkholderia sp. TaxID=1926495 RepID=UPI003D6E3F6A
MSGNNNGVGSTSPNFSHTQLPQPSDDAPATPARRSPSLRSQHSNENLPPARTSQEGTEMQAISRQVSVRSRRSLSPPIETATDQIERISADDVERALDTIVNEPLPPHVNSPASLWQHVVGRLQGALGGGVTAGITFGAFRGLGPLAEHTTNPGFGAQMAAQMPAVVIGGLAAGVGNTLALTVAAPVANALLSKALGTSTSLVPENPEHMVPEGYPNRDAQIAGIRKAQSRFGVDSLINILSGVVSFGGLHAVRGALTANANLSPGVGYAVAALTSFAAGGLTTLLTQTLQANNRITVQGPDGESQTLRLFKHASNPPPAVGAAVNAAVQGFTGGREGARAIAHVVSQIAQRGGIVTASTVGYGMTQAVIPTVRDAFMRDGQSLEDANSHAAAAMNAVGFTAVVIAYFTLLGKVAGTLPQRNPPPAQDPAGPGPAPR